MFKLLKLISKILSCLILAVLAIFSFVVVGLNLAKFMIYSDYYGMKTNYCVNPGLNDGAVQQGLAVDEERDIVLTTTYMIDKSPSRIYVTNSKNEDRYVELYKNDKKFTGHVGGISLSGDYAYISNNDTIYKISLNDILTKDAIDIGDGIKVNNQASFTYADDNYLYVGEFNYLDKYICENPIGDYKAICTKYSLDDLTKPVAIYSIRDKVQGFCVTDDGDIVLSTSWGVSSSEFYIYNSENIKQSGTYQDVPLYVLDKEDKLIKGPAMSEDLSYSNGKVYVMFESACNKYIFGKLFFANKVVGLEI